MWKRHSTAWMKTPPKKVKMASEKARKSPEPELLEAVVNEDGEVGQSIWLSPKTRDADMPDEADEEDEAYETDHGLFFERVEIPDPDPVKATVDEDCEGCDRCTMRFRIARDAARSAEAGEEDVELFPDRMDEDFPLPEPMEPPGEAEKSLKSMSLEELEIMAGYPAGHLSNRSPSARWRLTPSLSSDDEDSADNAEDEQSESVSSYSSLSSSDGEDTEEDEEMPDSYAAESALDLSRISNYLSFPKLSDAATPEETEKEDDELLFDGLNGESSELPRTWQPELGTTSFANSQSSSKISVTSNSASVAISRLPPTESAETIQSGASSQSNKRPFSATNESSTASEPSFKRHQPSPDEISSHPWPIVREAFTKAVRERDGLTDRVATTDTENARLRQLNQDLSNTNTDLKALQRTMDTKLKTLQMTMEQARQDQATHDLKLRSDKRELQAKHEAEIERMEKEMQDRATHDLKLRSDHDAEMRELQAKHGADMEKVEKESSEKYRLIEENYKHRINRLENEVGIVRADKEALQTENDCLKTKLDDFEGKYNSLESQYLKQNEELEKAKRTATVSSQPDVPKMSEQEFAVRHENDLATLADMEEAAAMQGQNHEEQLEGLTQYLRKRDMGKDEEIKEKNKELLDKDLEILALKSKNRTLENKIKMMQNQGANRRGHAANL